MKHEKAIRTHHKSGREIPNSATRSLREWYRESRSAPPSLDLGKGFDAGPDNVIGHALLRDRVMS